MLLYARTVVHIAYSRRVTTNPSRWNFGMLRAAQVDPRTA
jgi:hypothetical protein